MFGLIFGAVVGGLTMWHFRNRTRDSQGQHDWPSQERGRPTPSPADTAVRAQDRAKEQVHSGHSATSTIDPPPSSR